MVEKVYRTGLTSGSVAGASASLVAREKARLQCVVAEGGPAFKWEKIAVAAAVGGLALDVVTKPVGEVEALHGVTARTCILVTPQGTITQSNAVLRYVGNVAPLSGLYGASAFEEAEVDQWVEFIVLEVEVAVVAAVEDGSAATVQAAQADVRRALAVLNAQLEARTYLVGTRMTIADVHAVCVLKAAADLVADGWTATPHVLRWLLTCLHDPAVVKAIGEPTILAPKPPPSSSEEGKKKAPTTKTKTVEKEEAAGRPPTSRRGGGGGVVDPSTMFRPSFDRGRVRVKELVEAAAPANMVGATVVVKGWVRTVREAEKGATTFVEVNDGSSLGSIQVVAAAGKTSNYEALKRTGGAGSSVEVRGVVVESLGKGQNIEVAAAEVRVIGPTMGGPGRTVGAQSYPLAKKFHTLEHLRTHAHLRPRARFGSAVCRVRHALAFATHEFFDKLGFAYVHTPLITGSDCEGAGEMFTVTTLMPELGSSHKVPTLPNGDVDFSRDFFGKKVGLSVSGQLNVETHAAALSDCYTFGPTFRAENSHTSRHLAEFWMIEPEVSFADIHTDLALAQDYLKYCVAAALQRCDADLEFFEQTSKGLRDRLRQIVETPFVVLEYTEAIALLKRDIDARKATFENMDVEWGMDLGSEHEKYLTDVVYKAPVVLINYPKDIKAFYMKLNPDGKTVAAMDVLVPKIGELIGGSQREDDLNVLERRCKEVGVNPNDLKWYCDLRQYGSVPHAGFGLGFERLVMLVTGVENIRDVIPFPRYPGHCAF